MNPNKQLQLVAKMQIDMAGADAGEGKATLPRFSMVAYTGEEIHPRPDGAPVWLREVLTAEGDRQYWFDYASGIAGSSRSSSSSSSW